MKRQDSEQTASEAEEKTDTDREETDRPGDTEDASPKTETVEELQRRLEKLDIASSACNDSVSYPFSWLSGKFSVEAPFPPFKALKESMIKKPQMVKDGSQSSDQRRKKDTKDTHGLEKQDLSKVTECRPVRSWLPMSLYEDLKEKRSRPRSVLNRKSSSSRSTRAIRSSSSPPSGTSSLVHRMPQKANSLAEPESTALVGRVTRRVTRLRSGKLNSPEQTGCSPVPPEHLLTVKSLRSSMMETEDLQLGRLKLKTAQMAIKKETAEAVWNLDFTKYVCPPVGAHHDTENDMFDYFSEPHTGCYVSSTRPAAYEEDDGEISLHSTYGALMMPQHVSVCSSQPPRSDQTSTESCSRPRSSRTFRRAESLPDMKFRSSFEEFTPEFSEDGDDEVFSFHCSCPGLFQCSVTGLVFHMQGGGEVSYRVVPWDRGLLAPHHKKPAGPLFDIKCPQRCVSQLHLPHCEIRSTGGCGFLSVVHLDDGGVEFIPPHRITETHVIINITGFSAYGNVKEEDSPPDPVQALVLLFYRPPEDPDLTSFLSVMLLPRNIVIRDIQRTRKKLIGEERFIDVSPHCNLKPKQVYILSTAPEDELVKVDPTEIEFDRESHNSYFTSSKVTLKTLVRDIKLTLTDRSSSCCVWDRDVCLLPSTVKTLSLPSDERLLKIRSSFIDGISGPVLSSLLDKLLEKKVLTDAERESAEEKTNRRDRAASVLDTVRRKGEAASSEMIQMLGDIDLFLCKHLGLS